MGPLHVEGELNLVGGQDTRLICIPSSTVAQQESCITISLPSRDLMVLLKSFVASPSVPLSGLRFLHATDVQVALQNIVLEGFGASCDENGFRGGAVYAANSELTIKGSVFRNCTAGEGGGLFVLGGSLFLDSTTVEHCQACAMGGGIAFHFTDVQMAHSVVNRNTILVDNTDLLAQRFGGGLFCFGSSSFSVAESSIRNNGYSGAEMVVEEGVGVSGGGMSLQTCTMVLRDSIVKANIAQGGGGCYATDSSIHMTGTVLQDNKADRLGGAVAALSAREVNVQGCEFYRNTVAKEGGTGAGFFIDSPQRPVQFNGNTFLLNK